MKESGTLYSSPSRGWMSWYKPEKGAAFMAGNQALIVEDARWIDADLAEDFDWFDIAEAGGAWSLALREPETCAEKMACAEVEAKRSEHLRQDAEELARKEAEKAARNARLDAEKSERDAFYKMVAEKGLKSTDYTDWSDFNTPRIRCKKEGCPAPTECYHVGRTIWDQKGWIRIFAGEWQDLSTALNHAWKHPCLEIYVHAFGNRANYFASKSLVEKWLDKKIVEMGITRENAIEWLDKYRGCVATELYARAAGEEI